MKVLIIDDEINVRYVIRYIGEWKKNGITTILEASNGEDAIKIIKKQKPEIIFTDVKMPKMDGIEIIEWLDSISYSGKVILITGFDDYTYMRKAIQCSSFDYLLKPIEAESLNNTLSEAVQTWITENKDAGVLEDAKRLRLNQLATQACMGEEFDLIELASSLPDTVEYELTLISFYQMHHSEPYIQLLANQLIEEGIGNAFALQHDHSLCLVITTSQQWLSVEEWIIQQFDIPIRIVNGASLLSLGKIHESYQSMQKAVEEQNYRTIHRLNDIDDAKRMQDIVSYVDTYYMEELSLEKLSNRFFLSREHISRKFKQQTGMPLSKYIMKLRIERAKYLLREKDENIYAIALLLGYQDEKYFSKLFKKMVGLTPFEYRNCQKTLDAK
ncbi:MULTISPECIES: response regulator [Niallia]|uniref:Response regulator n=1 Tax=Niallia alba TaxID=2729105 RepID=A0A7Y0K6Z5_9BACI|nr:MULTISPECIES: response regulator [Niallia]MBQ6447688.1 response regulator [Bacillus sp. (in: firmicutes)]NMO76928.1 response regulator [Niallia alba]UTI40128.1 response regulator [Niallia sp. RD1]